MIFNRTTVQTNPEGEEYPEDGLELFDLAANRGDVRRFVGGCISFHWHTELEFFVLYEGQVQVSAGAQTCVLQAGEGCFINAGVLHSFQAQRAAPCLYRSFVFDAGIVGGAPGSVFDLRYVRPLVRSGMPFIRLDRRADTACFDAFERAFHACEEERPGYEFKIRAELSAILLLLGRRAPAAPPAAGQVQQARLKQILGWIDRHLENPITLRDLAGCAGVSPRECQRMFRRYLHCRPMEYLCQRRLLVAAEQLAAPSFSVTEIALQCGFSSPSYFSKQFKRLVGQTPAAYRAGQRQP